MGNLFYRLQYENLNHCVYCGQPATTRDHVPPKCMDPHNIKTVPACRRCNINILGGRALPTLDQRIAYVWFRLGILDSFDNRIKIDTKLTSHASRVIKTEPVSKETKRKELKQKLKMKRDEETRLQLLEKIKSNNYAGKKFGRWKVLTPVLTTSALRRFHWICECECGSVKPVLHSSLKNMTSLSCGCRGKRKRETGVTKDIKNFLDSEYQKSKMIPNLSLLLSTGVLLGWHKSTIRTQYAAWKKQLGAA